jgi:4-aminobutyrate aminotransferase/(S)-3-amino-2-methylpropionate transaminase
VSVADSLEALQQVFRIQADPTRVAAIFIEPVQGEGGFYPAPVSFLKALRRICDEHGILLIADEIQTGFGRTGKMFAMEHAGISADIVTMAKGLGGGFPVAAITGRAGLMDKIPAGGVGSTFAGNPLACAAAHAVLDVIEKERLVERAQEIGRRIRARIEPWANGNEFPSVGEVRGLGAMVAIEFVTDRATRAPAADLAKSVTRIALESGLLVLNCGIKGNGVRLLPPLTIPFGLLDEGLDCLEAAIRRASETR